MSKKEPFKKPKKSSVTRRDFLRFAGAAGAAAAGGALVACGPDEAAEPTAAPQSSSENSPTAVPENVNPLQGTTIRALLNDMAWTHFVVSKLPEFEELTGIKVEPEIVAFPVLLEQGEIELSSGSSNYDVTIQVFIKAQRWMRAGWSAPLDEFIASSNFDLDDFLPATTGSMHYEGQQYGIPFLAESTQMIYRGDILRESGLAVPKTFEELDSVLAAIHNPPDFHAYVMRTEPAGVHFPFPIWLQGFGGNVFRDPPNDLTPTLNTPEALAATENFVDLIQKYSIAGAQTYATPDCQNAMAQGLAGFWIDALGIFPPVRDPEKSKVADKVEIALPPGGPAGVFPQIASHGYQIPAAAKNKEAAWEFIAWATSADMMRRGALEAGHSAVPRNSILVSEEYGDLYNQGDSKVGELIAEALNLSKAEYRVVPEFPEVGNRLGQGIAEIVSGQKSVQQALDDVQRDAEQIMISAGREISP